MGAGFEAAPPLPPAAGRDFWAITWSQPRRLGNAWRPHLAGAVLRLPLRPTGLTRALLLEMVAQAAAWSHFLSLPHCPTSLHPLPAGGLWEVGEGGCLPSPASCPGCLSPGLAWSLPGEPSVDRAGRRVGAGNSAPGSPRASRGQTGDGPSRQKGPSMGKGGAGGLRSGCCLDSFIHSFNKSIQQLFDPYPEQVGCRRRDYSSEHGNSNDKPVLWDGGRAGPPALDPARLVTCLGVPLRCASLPPQNRHLTHVSSLPCWPGRRVPGPAEMGAGGLPCAAGTHTQAPDSWTARPGPLLVPALAQGPSRPPLPLSSTHPCSHVWIVPSGAPGVSGEALCRPLPSWDPDFTFSSRLQAVGGSEHWTPGGLEGPSGRGQ